MGGSSHYTVMPYNRPDFGAQALSALFSNSRQTRIKGAWSDTLVSAVVIKVYKYHAAGEPTRVIGQLFDDGIFRRNVNPFEHQLREPPAWCIDAPTFDDLERRAKSIRFYDTKNEVTWIISPAYFREHCGEIDRGHGRQYFCPLKYWQSVNKNAWGPVKTPEPEKIKQEHLL